MFQDGSDGVPTDSPQTLRGRDRRAEKTDAVREHCKQSSQVDRPTADPLPPLRRGSSVPTAGPPPEAKTTRAQKGPSYPPPGLVAAGEPVAALFPGKVRPSAAHTRRAGPKDPDTDGGGGSVN